MSLKEELVFKMREIGIEPKRSLGQNFLISEHIVEKIFKHVDQRAPPFVVEIGPGLGTLTERLIERNTPRMIVELDRKFAEYWRRRGEKVVEGDALQIKWAELNLPEKTLILSNLPYQIGSRLIIELSHGPKAIDVMVLMFQKEVAQRLTGKPKTKDYSFLSVVAQSFWSIDTVADASGEDFYPAPKVLSRVIALKRRKTDPRLDEKFIEFVKRAFQSRRKFMLKAFGDEAAHLKLILLKLGYKETVRAEEIDPPGFQSLFLENMGHQ